MMTPSRSPRPFVATMVCLPGAQRPLAGYRLPIHELGGVERCAQVQRLELPTQRRIDEVGGVVRRAADAELRVAAGDGARRGAGVRARDTWPGPPSTANGRMLTRHRCRSTD